MASVLKPGVRSVMASSLLRKVVGVGVYRTGVGRQGGKSECGDSACNSAGTLAPSLSLRRMLCPPYELFAIRYSLPSREARSVASVEPPAVVVRLSDMRWTPPPIILAFFEESVRELIPIQEISDESRPYSILGQRFITTLMPLASASAAASSLRTPSCIQITCGFGLSVSASRTIGSAYCEARKTSTMSIGSGISE